MDIKKYLFRVLLILIVALMVLPYVSAEDSMFLTSVDNGAQPPELPNEILLTSNNEPPELLTTTSSSDSNVILTGVNLTKVYGNSDNFTVSLKDSNGNNIIGQHIAINLTRLSSGANKVYDSVTDYTGVALLQINLAPGFYTASSTFNSVEGFNYNSASTFNTITVKAEDDNKIPTSLIAEPFVEVYGTGEFFNITLVDENNTPVIGQHIALTLTRPSSGASKTYDSVTDYTGVASLQINLAIGNYTVRGAFNGQGDYGSSMAATTITVVSSLPDTDGKDNSTPVQPPISPNDTNIDNGTVNPNPNTTLPNGTSPGDIPIPVDPVNPLENNTEVSNNTNASEGSLVVNGETVTLENAVRIFSSLTPNQNSILIGNGGNLTLIRATIVKMGAISNSEFTSSDLYGSNAAVLVLPDSVLDLSSGTLISAADGANGLFSTNLNSTNNGSKIFVHNTRIDTHLDSARGLMATFGGYIEGDNLVINTRGKNSPAVATGRGEGTIILRNSELYTGVLGAKDITASPIVYSTSYVHITDSTGVAYQSQIAYLEGESALVLDNVNFTAYGKGNLKDKGEYADLGGFFIYQSMAGDSNIGVAVLNLSNSVFTIPEDSQYYLTSPMFHVTNTESIINLNNCNLNFGSNTLLEVNGQNLWGQIGNNGGNVTLNANNQHLNGNILVDSISSLNLNLVSSIFSGAINPSPTYGNIDVSIDSNSAWILTDDTYINSLNNLGTINYNGHTLYVNGVAYNTDYPF